MLSKIRKPNLQGAENSMIGYFIKKYISILILMLLPQMAMAATFSISTPTPEGQFTLSWSDARSFAELYEVINGSSQKIGGQYNKTYSITYTKPPGTYTYIMVDVQAYGCGACPGGVAYNRTNIQRTVVVSPSAPPAMPPSITVIPDPFTQSFRVSWGASTDVPASRYELDRNGTNVYSGLGISTTVSGTP